MKITNMIVLLILIVASSMIVLIQLIPVREHVIQYDTVSVTVYDTITVAAPDKWERLMDTVAIDSRGNRVRLCDQQLRESIAGLEELSLYHDVPRLVEEACTGVVKEDK